MHPNDDFMPFACEYRVKGEDGSRPWRSMRSSWSRVENSIDEIQKAFRVYGADLEYRVVDRRNGEIKQEMR